MSGPSCKAPLYGWPVRKFWTTIGGISDWKDLVIIGAAVTRNNISSLLLLGLFLCYGAVSQAGPPWYGTTGKLVKVGYWLELRGLLCYSRR